MSMALSDGTSSLGALTVGSGVKIVGLSVILVVLYYVYQGFLVRRMFQRLQKQGVPMMPHHPVLGHLAIVGKLMQGVPPDAHGDYMMVLIQEHWRELFPADLVRSRASPPPVVYVDAWPFSPPVALSMHPDVSAQFTQQVSLDKAANTARFLHPLTHGHDVSSANGDVARSRRRRLNPVFSPQAIAARVPDLLEEVEVFRDLLKAKAGKDGNWGDVFAVEEPTTLLTLDFIARFALDVRLHEQTTPLSPMSAGMLDTIPRMRFNVHVGNFLSLFSPWRFYAFWRNTRAMDAFLLPIIHSRLSGAAVAEGDSTPSSAAAAGGGKKSQTSIEMLARSMAAAGEPAASVVPALLGETKHTVFAGHETTAFSLCWLLHTLHRYPAVLAAVRAEHAAVLGRGDPAKALRASPALLNALPYTAAVIKESMRVNTNVGSLRQGREGFVLVGPSGAAREEVGGKGGEVEEYAGVVFPTERCVLWDANFAVHRDPRWWDRPEEFVPERWLGGGGEGGEGGKKADAEHWTIRKNAYRPFLQGPRNCVGQYLAVTELKLVLVLIVREVDVEPAWDEWDRMLGRKGPQPMVWGDRLYQVAKHGPPHVKDGLPVRVRIAKKSW